MELAVLQHFSLTTHVCMHVCNNQNKLLVCQADVRISSVLKMEKLNPTKTQNLSKIG